jgi:hypothetical protein
VTNYPRNTITMPAVRPCAAFEPISPDFDVKQLVESSENFDFVPRIQVSMVDARGVEEFEKLVRKLVIQGGRPLVIEGYQAKLDRWTFALQWLRDNCSTKVENARDLTKKANVPLSIGHYLNHMALLTDQWNTKNYKEPARQRMYLKDIDCPQLWHEKLQDLVPLNVFYLNDSIGEVGGLGSVDEGDPSGSGTRKGRGVAKSGDLMASLPKEMRAENLMCYIGHEGTYTPAHKEMCASLGQNIMVETSTGGYEDGKPTKPGSSIWFMTETKEREVVSEYWLSKLGHDIEVENHFAQINAWRAAPFKTWVVEQKVGDLILIPPLAPHQVWNRGTRTMKVAWNRTTVETLDMALHIALPAARMVCRDEQYKNKAIIYYTLQKYSKQIKLADKQKQRRHRIDATSDAHVQNLKRDFRKLQALFTEILVSESFYPANVMNLPKPDMLPYESFITCSYCRCNIFNRFLTCPSCVSTFPDGEQDTYDICMDCYAMGRSCACISKLKWVEQWSWVDLTQHHEKWRQQILQTEAHVSDQSPKSLRTELGNLGKHRTLAQVCQSELAHRPFNDIMKPKPANNLRKKGELEVEVDDNGNVKKSKRPKRSEKFMREHGRCHVDCHWEPKWKQADCSNCDKKYCFGLLFRGYDMMPQDILADPEWICPSCRNICSCRNCKDKPGFKAYTPSGTMLGHNTKAIADPRSVESLVDFGFSNISWIQKMGDDNEDDTRRMKKRQIAAEKAKLQDQEDDAYGQDDGIDINILMLAQQEGIPIDPALAAMSSAIPTSNVQKAPEGSQDDEEDEYDENPEQARALDQGFGGPPAPQYVIPDGGVVRDLEHAYDNTEAITYDYPDPEMGLQLPVPVEEASAEGVAPGYEPAVQPNDGDIAMIERKRKQKPDEGDMPFGKTTPSKKKKTEKRKSLIVKLNVDKFKLAEVQSIADIAQQALNGVATVEAPVISSDLNALNIYGGNSNGQARRKKDRLEEDESEEDEFTPGRYRYRRRTIPEGAPRPDPDADITRRQTRLQVTNYEEPDDDDMFDDFGEDAMPESVSNSKLATMQQAEQEVHAISDDDDDETASLSQDAAQPAQRTGGTLNGADPMDVDVETIEVDIVPVIPPEKPATIRPSTGGILNTALASASAVLRQNGQNGVHVNGGGPLGTSKQIPAPSNPTAKPGPWKFELQARANQRAKMAAMGLAKEDSSATDEDEEEPPQKENVQALVGRPKPDNRRETLPAARSTPVATQRQSTPKFAPGPAQLRSSSSLSASQAQSKVALPKVSATDWGDSNSSESDSDVPPKKSGFTAVNKGTGARPRGLPPINLYTGKKR